MVTRAPGITCKPQVVEYDGPPGTPGEAARRFNEIYEQAGGDPALIPWARGKPSPTVVSWLDEAGPCVVRPGARTVVVGCGLGDDAAILAERGYEVTAFDVSSRAIADARCRHPHLGGSLMEADLLDLPCRLKGRFDLVVEVHTLQALPPRFRGEVARGLAALLTHHGVLLVASRGRDPAIGLDEVDGPPWPFTLDELRSVLEGVGLGVAEDAGGLTERPDDQRPPVRRICGAFRRI